MVTTEACLNLDNLVREFRIGFGISRWKFEETGSGSEDCVKALAKSILAVFPFFDKTEREQ